MTNLIQISATISPSDIDLLSELFFALGAETVTLTDAKDEPLFQLSPEDQPHWQQTTVHGLFAFDEDSTEARTFVFNENTTEARTQRSEVSASNLNHIISTIKNNAAFATTPFDIQTIENKNWVEETQKQFHAQQFESLWICPQWEKDIFLKAHANDTVVFIEPGLAFGTGTHPTTQLCLTWLATHDLKNKVVVDYGCGSGILALAACAEGAAVVYATDHDQQALESTLNNADYNYFDQAILHTRKTNDMSDVKADIIVANILANTLIDLVPTLANLLLPNGKLILSGILVADADRVFSAYQPNFTRTDTQHKDGWVLMELRTTKNLKNTT